MALNTLRVKRQNALIISPTKRVRRVKMGRRSPGTAAVLLGRRAGSTPRPSRRGSPRTARVPDAGVQRQGHRRPGARRSAGLVSRAEAARWASVSGPCWGPMWRDGFGEFCGATDQARAIHSFTHTFVHSQTFLCALGVQRRLMQMGFLTDGASHRDRQTDRRYTSANSSHEDVGRK